MERKEKEFYDYLGQARSATLTALENYRVHRTLALLPQDAQSVIDIASGDGRLARHLLDAQLCVQTDLALSSLLAAPKNNRVQADIMALPFASESFDLAMCCEGLEHFPDEVYEVARREILRVTRNYILITVPYRENMLSHLTKCGACGKVYHKWGHVRSFTKSKIRDLFSGFELHKFECFGKSQPAALRLVQRINQKYGGVYTQPSSLSVCIYCGHKEYTPHTSNPVSLAMGAINRITARVVPTGQRNWAAALFVRR